MNVEISCGKCARRMTSHDGSGEKVNFCPFCGAPVEISVGSEPPVLLETPTRDAGSPDPIVISRADVGQVGPKRQVASSPEPFVQRPKGASSAIWVIVPAVAAVTAAFGFLMCGGLFFFLLAFGGGSEAEISPQPYTAYSVPDYSYPSDPYASTPGDPYGSTASDPASYPTPMVSDYSSTPYAESPYVPASYGTDPYAVAPADVAPTYVEPIPVEPAYIDPLASPAGETPLWSFADPESDLLTSIQEDEQKLVEYDAAILAARAGEIAGEVEAQDGETAADQLLGVVFAVGSDAVEQGLLTERAAVQARLDANRAELTRLRGY